MRIYVDGVIGDEHTAVVPVLDRGFLYGDGVYEVTRTVGRRAVDLAAHLDRLERSAARIGLVLPPRATIEGAIAETLLDGDCYVRVVVTRGAGEMGLDPALADRPRLVVIVRPLALPAPKLYEEGATLRIVSVERTSPRALDPAIKSGNYLNNILAIAEARRSAAYEAVLLDERGRVTEGSSSNVWCVRGGEALTPPTSVGLLPGITRWRLFQLAAEGGVSAREAELDADDLRGADEVFLTSSIRGVLPIRQVDDREIAVGPVTRRLHALYEDFLRSARI